MSPNTATVRAFRNFFAVLGPLHPITLLKRQRVQLRRLDALAMPYNLGFLQVHIDEMGVITGSCRT